MVCQTKAVANVDMGKKGQIVWTWGAGILRPYTHVGRSEFAGEEPEAAVVEGPVAVVEEMRAALAFGFGDEFRFEISGEFCGDGAAEHVEKVPQAVLAVFERGGTIEEAGVGEFQVVAFEKGRVFGGSGRVGVGQVFARRGGARP